MREWRWPRGGRASEKGSYVNFSGRRELDCGADTSPKEGGAYLATRPAPSPEAAVAASQPTVSPDPTAPPVEQSEGVVADARAASALPAEHTVKDGRGSGTPQM